MVVPFCHCCCCHCRHCSKDLIRTPNFAKSTPLLQVKCRSLITKYIFLPSFLCDIFCFHAIKEFRIAFYIFPDLCFKQTWKVFFVISSNVIFCTDLFSTLLGTPITWMLDFVIILQVPQIMLTFFFFFFQFY